MTDIASEKYVRLTTFTKDGQPKHTPVWIADTGSGKVATTTDDDSWKIKRIRRTAKVELAASDGKGNVGEGSATFSGQATLVDCSDPEYAHIESAFIEKYGMVYRLFRLIRKIRGKTACGISITID